MSDNTGVPDSLAELLARCRAGDREAFDALIRRFHAYGLSLAESLSDGRADAAEDAVQSAFVTVLTRIEDLRDADAFPGWLRQIVRTECNRLARRRTATTLDGVGAASHDDPLGKVVHQEHLARVRQAVANLPAAQRATAELFYLDELPQAEISRALNIPAGTVKRRLYDARATLRATLSEQGKPESRLPI